MKKKQQEACKKVEQEQLKRHISPYNEADYVQEYWDQYLIDPTDPVLIE